MKAIEAVEKIRAEVLRVREAHKAARTYAHLTCVEAHPCLLVQLAEDKLKLAEHVYGSPCECYQDATPEFCGEPTCDGAKVLNEVAR